MWHTSPNCPNKQSVNSVLQKQDSVFDCTVTIHLPVPAATITTLTCRWRLLRGWACWQSWWEGRAGPWSYTKPRQTPTLSSLSSWPQTAAPAWTEAGWTGSSWTQTCCWVWAGTAYDKGSPQSRGFPCRRRAWWSRWRLTPGRPDHRHSPAWSSSYWCSWWVAGPPVGRRNGGRLSRGKDSHNTWNTFSCVLWWLLHNSRYIYIYMYTVCTSYY